MADLLRITSVVNAKNYNLQSKPISQSDAVFDLVDLSKVIKTNDKTQDFRQNDNSFTGNNSDALLDIQLKIAKNPSYTVKLLRDLLSDETVSQFLQSGSPDVVNEFNEFSKNIFLAGGDITADLISQQKGTTAFSGELFDLLRNIANLTNTKELKTAIAFFLKNAFSLESQGDILKSLSANFMYLSESMAPSKSISAQLEAIAQKLSSMNASADFQNIKADAMALLDSVLNSLIATDKIKNMVSLIKYNISRFNDNPNIVDSGFKSILGFIHNQNLKDLLSSAYDKFIQSSDMPNGAKNMLLANGEPFLNGENLAYKLASLANEQSSSINAEMFEREIGDIANQLSKILGTDGNLQTITLEQGAKAINDLLKTLLPNNADDISKLLADFTQSKDLNVLITRLSFILNNVGNAEVQSSLANILNKVLTSLSSSPDIIYQPPTSMENLASFLTKAINNQNISHLGIIDPNTIVQSMLTAPGVFTPLLHFILPVQIENLRSFGELWVDNDSLAGNSESGEEDSQHLFLSFDIEKVGQFELEIFSKDNNLNVSLFCPKNYVSFFSAIKNKISDVASNCGYTIKKSTIEPLVKNRTLVDIFPRIAERRAGLNVKI